MKNLVDCVGIVCLKSETWEVLLIQRGSPPRKGEWSIPGGRVQPGESEFDAAVRELFEETGVTAKIIDKIESIPAKFEGYNYRLHDYLALWTSGIPRAGDDAQNARFVPISRIGEFGMWSETERIINKAVQFFNTDEKF